MTNLNMVLLNELISYKNICIIELPRLHGKGSVTHS